MKIYCFLSFLMCLYVLYASYSWRNNSMLNQKWCKQGKTKRLRHNNHQLHNKTFTKQQNTNSNSSQVINCKIKSLLLTDELWTPIIVHDARIFALTFILSSSLVEASGHGTVLLVDYQIRCLYLFRHHVIVLIVFQYRYLLCHWQLHHHSW